MGRAIPLEPTGGAFRVSTTTGLVTTVGRPYHRGRTNSAWYQTTVEGKEALGELKSKSEQVR